MHAGSGLPAMHGVFCAAASLLTCALRHRGAAVRHCMPLLMDACRAMLAALVRWAQAAHVQNGPQCGAAAKPLLQCAGELARCGDVCLWVCV